MEFIRKKRRFLAILLSLVLICAQMVPALAADSSEVVIVLSDEGITVNGQAASSDPADAVYLSHDIIYYEDRETYDSGNLYGEGTASERHSTEEAADHTVVNITKPGAYRISGTLSKGQIFVDLGSGAKSDPNAVVTLLLDNADITCTVAPAVFFYRVYECDHAWVAYDDGKAETYTPSAGQDTSKAGANVIIAAGSVNKIDGSHVARIYKDNSEKKKLHKYDAAFYSRMSMNINGEASGTGVLDITADNEGLDSELHLTINGGKINIQSQDDGINTNEDNVSVTTINGGALHIVAGLGSEGDGIDSNGFLVINGGVVIATARPQSDSGLDSDSGSYINGGYVVATGSTMDWAESDSKQVTMNLRFASAQNADEAVIVTDQKGKVIFAYDPDKDETSGNYNRGYQGAVISCPEFQVGDTYNVYVGGDVHGTEVDGLYDAATVTGFTGAYRQQYTGTSVGFGPGGGQPGGMEPGDVPDRPDGMQPGDVSDRPNGMQPGDVPDRPDGMEPGNVPDRPDGMQPGGEPDQPNGMGPGQQPDSGDASNASNMFYMEKTVNSFSGVTDEAGEPVNMGTPSDDKNTDDKNPENTSGLTLDSAAWHYDAQNDVYWQIGVVYCTEPQATAYESMGIYVPGAYLNSTPNGDGTYTCTVNNSQTVNGYTAGTAPIVMPVNTAGYSAQKAPASYSYNDLSDYLDNGFIYVYAGCRGRNNGTNNDGTSYDGGAPWGVTDLKAAVRYLRYNASVLPGDTDKIFTFGHSGGGAQSALMGATGDSKLYDKYLESIGAAMYDDNGNYISDAVCGAMCWCPITSLDYADEAYEWMMGQYSSSGTRANSTWTSALSDDMAEAFADYINELRLTDESGTVLTLSGSGTGIYTGGSYYDYLLKIIEKSLNNFLADTNFPYTSGGSEMADGGFAGGGDRETGGDLPEGGPSGGMGGSQPEGGPPDGTGGSLPEGGPSGGMGPGGSSAQSKTYETAQDYINALNSNVEWVIYDAQSNMVSIASVEAFVQHCKSASKNVGAFDGLNCGEAENMLFGNGTSDALHFDATMAKLLNENREKYAGYSDYNDSYAEAYADDMGNKDTLSVSTEIRQNMYNPMYYLCDYYEGSGSSTVAKYWRIHSGITQGDTALTTEMNLALALQSCDDVESVDFAAVWEKGHTTAERTGDSTTNFIAWANDCAARMEAARMEIKEKEEKTDTYYISIPTAKNGEVIPSARYAEQGERVTLSVYPDTGYELDRLAVFDIRGREITLRDLGDSRYSFTMPGTRVTVEAAFREAEMGTPESTAPADDEPFTGLGTPGVSGIVLNPTPMTFTDIHAGDWFYDNVDYVWKHYLMSGVSETQFAPNATTSRAMIWTVLARMNNVRTDINPGATWYERSMLWAMEQGITDGSSAMGDVTREQLAAMLWRNAGSPSAGGGDLSRFSDAGTVSAYAQTAVRWAVANGILNGYDGMLNPKGTATRAQVAAMVARYGDKIA